MSPERFEIGTRSKVLLSVGVRQDAIDTARKLARNLGKTIVIQDRMAKKGNGIVALIFRPDGTIRRIAYRGKASKREEYLH